MHTIISRRENECNEQENTTIHFNPDLSGDVIISIKTVSKTSSFNVSGNAIKELFNHLNEYSKEVKSDANTNLIDEIKKDMRFFYLFELTTEQISEYLAIKSIDNFDTGNREDYVQYLAKKITGFNFPKYKDNDKYSDIFFALLKEKSKQEGYLWHSEK